MRRFPWVVLFLCQAACLSWGATKQPVYIFLSTTVSDHLNMDMSEARLRRIVAMLGKYRERNPSVAATVLFSGAMCEALEKENGQTHFLDVVRGAIDRHLIDAGYDGADEPTYANRPLMDFSHAEDPSDRWFVRAAMAEKLLAEGRDPLTGAARPGTPGGLVKMQQVLGPAAYIRGVMLLSPSLFNPLVDIGVDSEIVHEIRRFNTGAVMEGIGNFDTGHIGLGYFQGWLNAFGKSLSPAEDTAPELYWQDGILRSSEAAGADLRMVPASDGVEPLKQMLQKLDRSRPRILHIELAGPSAYAKPYPSPMRPNLPLRYGYEHPANPAYPAALRKTPEEVDAAFAVQESVLDYLINGFFAENPGSRFVSATALKDLTPGGWGYELPMSSLLPAVQAMLKSWGDSKIPPRYLRVEDHYLSQADLFGVLADALAQVRSTGKLPQSVRVARVNGPIETSQQIPTPSGEVTLATVLRKAAEYAAVLRDDPQHERSWTPMPLNVVPSQVSAEGLTMNPAQFLRLMAEALTAPAGETMLKSKPTQLFWGPEPVYNIRRPGTDLGVAWTYRPAVLKTLAAAVR